MKHLCLIDGSGYIFRAFYGIRSMTRSDGTPINAVYGFTNMMIKLLKDNSCDYFAVIFDAKRKNFRNEIYADYKSTRKETPEDLIPQFEIIRQATDALNIAHFEIEGYEADDLIATYTKLAKEKGYKVTIVSGDKDLMQLVEDNVFLYDPMKSKSIGENEVLEKFGVPPKKVIDVQALSGDSVDNIPGVPGIGPKTASLLIKEYNSLEELLDRASEIKQKKRRENLIEFRKQAEISKKLVTLEKNVPVSMEIEEFKVKMPETKNLMKFLDEQEFSSIKPRAERLIAELASGDLSDLDIDLETISPQKKEYEILTDKKNLDEWIEKIKEKGFFAFDTETTNKSPLNANLVGISLCVDEKKACYIPLRHKQSQPEGLFDFDNNEKKEPTINQLDIKYVLEKLKPLFENKAILKIGHNIKYDIHIIKNEIEDIKISPIDDTMILSYVLDARSHGHGLDELAKHYFDHDNIKFSDVCGSGKNQITFDLVSPNNAVDYACEDADITMRLYNLLKKRLVDEKMVSIYENLDRPLINVLLDMERAGIKVDEKELINLSDDFNKKIKALSLEIYELAGEEFNIGSPKQLGEVLFSKLGIEGAKKSKKSKNFSTDAKTLEKLAQEDIKIADKILQWRHYSKLKSTYSDALAEQINKRTNRIHTSFMQTVTTTGRLSSNNPNLQNIPIRTEEGRKIRKTFVAKRGYKIIASDYSQVELRLIAHVANVKALKEAFVNGADIHSITAAKVFNVNFEDVTSDMRRKAKAVNFGIIYGISAFGLAKQIDSTRTQAQEIIDAYFNEFPEIKKYMEETVEYAKKNGFVKTLFGRKCFTDGISDKNPMKRNFAERVAINAPIQGGAADIIKIAMKKLNKRLKEEDLDAKILLQVHDELVIEALEADIEKTIKITKETMENVIDLSVPLIADANASLSWADAH